MSPAELLTADDHLATCDACRTQVSDEQQVQAAFSSLRSELKALALTPQEHLTYEQIAAYVDDRLSVVDREVVDSHTSVCVRCKEELRELFAFKETLGAVATVPTQEKSLRAPGFGERVAAWWAALTPGLGMPLAGTLALLFFAVLVVWLARRSDHNPPPVAIAQPTPSPVITQSPAPTVTPPSGQNDNAVDADTVNTDQRRTPVPPSSQPQAAPTVETSQPQLALNDGGRRIILNGRGDLEGLAELPPAERDAVRSALKGQRLETPAALAEVAGTRGTLMGNEPGGVAFSLLSPAGVVIDSDRPTFRWRALADANSYTVKIYDNDFDLITTGDALNVTSWTPRQPLERGKIYRWQVTATTKDGREVLAPAPPAPEARFKLLGRAQGEELARSLQASGNSHLARGVIYTRAGLLDEAEREFAALLKENPESAVARKLLNSLRRMRRAP